MNCDGVYNFLHLTFLRIYLELQVSEKYFSPCSAHEVAIAEYNGDDPLEPWYDYICWIEQSCPKSGKESSLDKVITQCIQNFENDERYRQDRRMIKIYMKFIDTQSNPQNFYQEMYNQGIGTMVADFYIGWAYYYDAIDNFKKTDEIYRKGLDARAQPLDELDHAHKQFGFTMSQRILHKDDPDNQEEFRSSLEERRKALTSLRTHRRGQVGTIRTGEVIRSHNPGIVNQENLPRNTRGANVAVNVYDQEVDTVPRNESIIKTIVDKARERENTYEPGPWNKAKLGKSGPLFSSAASSQLSFNIAVDEEGFTPIPYTVKTFDKGLIKSRTFTGRNQRQDFNWNVPLVVLDNTDAKSVPCYSKSYLYPKPNQEYNPEEWRAYRWHKQRGTNQRFTSRYDPIWSDRYECGARLPPAFVTKNLPQPQWERTQDLEPPPIDNNARIMCRYALMVRKGQPDQMMEELMMKRWQIRREAGRKQLFDYEQDDVDMDDSDCAMEETFIGQRRISIHPLKLARDSLLPRKSMALDRRSVFPSPRLSDVAESTSEMASAITSEEHQFAEPFVVPRKIAKPRDSLALFYAKKQTTSNAPTIDEDEESTAPELMMKRKDEDDIWESSSSKNRCMSKYITTYLYIKS